MSDPYISERSAACIAALEELFRQYPPLPWPDKAKERRRRAISNARRGMIYSAISWAKDTGVPDDVLNALRGLLDG